MAKVAKDSEKKSRGGSKKGERRGGRQKGTPNKKTLEFVQALGSFDPVKCLKELFQETDDDNIKLKICTECLKYIYPQRKAVEFKTEENQLPDINIKGI